MSDAIVLLAISQVVCLGGMAYLYMQFQGVARRPRPRHANATMIDRQPVRVHEPAPQVQERQAIAPATAARAYAVPELEAAPAARAAAPVQAAPAQAEPVATARNLAAAALQGQADISAIARRMNKSEEEVRLLLRRQAVTR